MPGPWRLELFFKTVDDLRAQIPFLKSCHQGYFEGVNITNKSKNDDLVRSLKVLRQEMPTLNVCLHISLKHQPAPRGKDPFEHRIIPLMNALNSDELHGCSVLLVNGSGPKRKLDTIATLKRLSSTDNCTPIFVAFNPYLPIGTPRNEEYARLKQKLQACPKNIAGVYLQMGTDLDSLEKGIKFLIKQLDLVSVHGCSTPNQRQPLRIYGSIFFPTRKLLAQMRFRPWNGVYLTDEYLKNVENAKDITDKLLTVYRTHGVTPLLESPIHSKEELELVQKMLSE
jgi:hypothetical protein